MPEGISIDLGTALPYLEDRILSIFGKDAVSLAWRNKIRHLVLTSIQQSSTVQCVGMVKPIPISQIYQPTRLTSHVEPNAVDALELLQRTADAIMFAGPGWGKTTLMHWVYSKLHRQDSDWLKALRPHEPVPILFTLRWPEAVNDLVTFIESLAGGQRASINKRDSGILLLVDGYDEVDESDRRLISKALVQFQSLKIGCFWLTCRCSYHVYDLKADQFEIAPFSPADSLGFARAFLNIYGVSLDPGDLLRELNRHGFSDFASHPLMLALVCILKSGPGAEIPRRAIGLIRRAIDTLTFRWDEAKGIHRQSTVPLDGEERVRSLMRIAYEMQSHQAEAEQVEASLRRHLALMPVSGVDVRKLLEEMARWYGLLIPIDAHHWQFVHRTIHDYLAARFWVESGEFSQKTVNEWNVRAAYAASLVPDATIAISRMLRMSTALSPFDECLYNAALFENGPVAEALIERVARRREYSFQHRKLQHGKRALLVALNSGCLLYATPAFLAALVRVGSSHGTDGGKVVALLSLHLLRQRGELVDPAWIGKHLKSWYALFPDIAVEVQLGYGRISEVQISDLLSA